MANRRAALVGGGVKAAQPEGGSRNPKLNDARDMKYQPPICPHPHLFEKHAAGVVVGRLVLALKNTRESQAFFCKQFAPGGTFR